jgi:hypothetical protein
MSLELFLNRRQRTAAPPARRRENDEGVVTSAQLSARMPMRTGIIEEGGTLLIQM